MTNFVRRAGLMAGCALLSLSLSSTGVASANGRACPAGCLNPDSQQLLDAVNGLRVLNGRFAFQQQEQLNARAQQWAEYLASVGRLQHSDLRTLPVPFSRAGENVAYGASVQQVHEVLAASRPHRANINEWAYTDIGIGTARGWGGRVYAVEVFRG